MSDPNPNSRPPNLPSAQIHQEEFRPSARVRSSIFSDSHKALWESSAPDPTITSVRVVSSSEKTAKFDSPGNVPQVDAEHFPVLDAVQLFDQLPVVGPRRSFAPEALARVALGTCCGLGTVRPAQGTGSRAANARSLPRGTDSRPSVRQESPVLLKTPGLAAVGASPGGTASGESAS